jgi:hypothetical protein
MARNHQKYEYIELAIPRGSLLHQALAADAATSGKSKADVAQMRLADYYQNGSQPRASAQTTRPLPAVSPATQTALRSPGSVAEQQEPEYQPERAAANAAAMLDLDGFNFG